MKPAVTIGLSLLIVLSAAVYFFNAAPQQLPADNAEKADTPTTQKMPLPAPVIQRLSNPLECFRVAGARYEGAFADHFNGEPREGVITYNTCDKYVTLMDLKIDSTNLAYVSSVLPVRVILEQMKDKTGKTPDRPERIIALTRTGAHCSAEQQDRRACLTIALPPGQAAFVSVPVRNWFRLRLKDEEPVTGYLPEAIDPAAPPVKKRVPPMPHPQPLYRPK